MIRHFTASMVVLSQDGTHVLLVWHNASQKWVFPGGHIDAGETAGQAAQREVKEETGLQVRILDYAWELPGATWEPSPWITAIFPAPAKPERPGKPAEDAHEHIDMLFVGKADSTEPLSFPLDEVTHVAWFPVKGLGRLDGVRAEVPELAQMARAR